MGFESSDWLTIISIGVGLAVQSFGFFKWQTIQFQKRDEALNAERDARDKQMDVESEDRRREDALLRERTVANRDMITREAARLDRDHASTRHEMALAISALPTREYIEGIFNRRFEGLEVDFRTLVLELARNGLPINVEKKKP